MVRGLFDVFSISFFNKAILYFIISSRGAYKKMKSHMRMYYNRLDIIVLRNKLFCSLLFLIFLNFLSRLLFSHLDLHARSSSSRTKIISRYLADIILKIH